MKRIFQIVGLFLIIILILTGSAIAAALPGSGWWTGETIQNVSTTNATLNFIAYDPDSPTTYPIYNDTISPGANKVYDPTNFSSPMPQGYQGSGIVSSDQPLRGVVNVVNRYISNNGLGDPGTPHAAAGMYQGMNVSSTTLRFPIVKNDSYGKSTSFFIQNTGTLNATATATFKLPNANGTITNYVYTTPSIGPGKMVVLFPIDGLDSTKKTPPSGNAAIGSLTVTSTQLLAGIMLEYKTGEIHGKLVQATRAATPSDYATKLYAPTIKNNFYGRFSGLQVQNVGSSGININVSYKGSDFESGGVNCIGNYYLDSYNNLNPGESANFPSTAIPDKCFASATVNATGSGNNYIIGLVNESFTSIYLLANPGLYQESTAYSTFPNNSVTTKIALPIVKEDSYSKETGLTIQNVSTSNTTTTVVLTYKGVAGTFVTNPQSISAGASIIIIDVRFKPASFWNGPAMTPQLLGCVNSTTGCGANGVFSVIVQSTSQAIVAMANESTYPINAPRILQDKAAYEGFNLAP